MTAPAFETSNASKAAVVVRRLSSHFPRPLRRRSTRPASFDRYTEIVHVCKWVYVGAITFGDSGRVPWGRGEALRVDYKRKGWVEHTCSLFFSLHYLTPSIFFTVLSERRRIERESGDRRPSRDIIGVNRTLLKFSILHSYIKYIIFFF